VRLPNLLSHLFKHLRPRLSADWQAQYRITPVLMETFVEIPRFTGATYKASPGGPMSASPRDADSWRASAH